MIMVEIAEMGYKQLDFRKRCQIYGLWRAGHKQSDIAKEVGVHPTTIGRELKRNITFVRTALGSWQYKPNYAQTYTEDRHKNKPKKTKFTDSVEKFVREKIVEDWSPEQISGKEKGGKLYTHLRHQNKKYRKRYGSPKRQGPIKNRRFIEERPEIVDKKERIGDWEIDTIIGKRHSQAIVSIVDRVSKKTVLAKVKKKTAEDVSQSTIAKLKPFAEKVFTITGDNGSEFAYHEKISVALKADFYFAHPYSSWERGLNENTNGLVRQYLKKGSDFSDVSDNDLELIMNKLNSRPRKSLNFATPDKIFSG